MSPSYPDSSSITDMLSQAVEAAKIGAQAQAERASQTVEVEVAEGRVRVSANLVGKVTVAIVDPRALRLGAEALGEEITAGVNAALDKAREESGTPGEIDLAGLSEKMEQLQQESAQKLRGFMDGLSASHEQIVRTASERLGGGN
ncbi:YbaB/EbfC family nucleoid-associated protein [Glycomyces tritici]|uniref:YbaB/EbfC family nucleoid-associated protein n=1 Tax=Glycomyces tritici TaxID=2665176 RepID=A0ABT7YYY3_9ACTN|nr:YbaB/EbfC family nucleoid-associated protein [Glycomyces tritici]MDN3243830.1 YbaB/EbfC family nucleoid-associated protein [Glycomyces tritici]